MKRSAAGDSCRRWRAGWLLILAGLAPAAAAQAPHPEACARLRADVEAGMRPWRWDALCPDLAAEGGRFDAAVFDAGFDVLHQAADRCLASLRCASGAYNERRLLFVRSGPRAAGEIVLFPVAGPPGAQLWALYFRDYDAATGTLYAYAKESGDGSGGDYAEYELAPPSFLPRLRYRAVKHPADYRDGYHFERGRRPAGAGWRVDATDATRVGCRLPIAALPRVLAVPVDPCAANAVGRRP